MPKSLLKLVASLAALCVCCVAAAQGEVALETRQAELRNLSQFLLERDARDRAQARQFAQRIGIPVRRELPGGRVLELQRVVPGRGPIFYLSNNVDAADTVSTDEVWPGGSAGLSLDGAGMIVSQWDVGEVYPAHPDFAGRLTQVDGVTGISGHSTHVAGTLIGSGDGLYPSARGMAYAAHLNAYDWNSDTAEMASAASGGLLVSNHSYGIAAGWLYVGGVPPDQWWWIGGSDPSDVEDPNFGYYDAESQLWDQIAFDAPYYLVVKASGNDHTDIGPAPGEVYTVIDQDGNPLFTSTLPRNPDCWPLGYDCLPTHSVAKNILTVGAVDDLIGGYSPLGGPSSVQIADFSSWGPSDDGRIKPDLVGNGMFLLSTWPDSPFYAVAAGTSMSAPNVTGSLLLLQEHHEDINGVGNFMLAATLKALAIHTADEAGDDDGPDYTFGWGLLNTKSAASVITGDGGGDHQIIEGSLANSTVDSVPVNVLNPDDILTATLVWADPPGTPVAPSLDPQDLMLVNDLDLRIVKTPTTYLPWVLDPGNPAAAATTGDNIRDNVEQVVASGGGSGVYTVEVSHKGTLLNGLAQDYSLIISIRPPPPSGSGLLIDEDFSGGLPAGWTLQSNTNPVVNWAIKTPVPGGSRLDNLTGSSGNFAMADFAYGTEGDASLRTPLLDLSANTAAILRFKSQYNYDTWESLNVDASINGGTNWINQWNFQGFNPFPTQYVLDISSTVAGQASVMLRFRFDSEFSYSGDYWQVDDIELEVFGGAPSEDPPGPPSGPSPGDGASGQATNTQLSWTAGANADSHDVYFGTSTPLGGGDFQGNQGATSFDPGLLGNSTTYYWRIDEVNGGGTTAGPTWSFSTEAAPPPPGGTVNIAMMMGNAIPAPKGKWDARVEVFSENQDDVLEDGVTVHGVWSNGANGDGSCVTSGGSCPVIKANLRKQVSNVTFTVTDLVKAGMSYEPGDNVGGDSMTVNKNDVDQTPSASNDSYQTDVNVPVGGNVMDNDNQGDGPASINSNTLPSDGNLSLAADGSFTYTPDLDFDGSDSFTYDIIDQDLDISNTATVSITVSSSPPPPPPGGLTVDTRPYKVKGVQHVEVTWSGFTSADVNVSRDGELLTPATTPNDGSHVDNIGVKGGGQTYIYEVCETINSDCLSAAASF